MPSLPIAGSSRLVLLIACCLCLGGCSSERPSSPENGELTPPIVIELTPDLQDGRLTAGDSQQVILSTNLPVTYSAEWSVQDSSIVTVNRTGMAYGRRVGTTLLTVSLAFDLGYGPVTKTAGMVVVIRQ